MTERCYAYINPWIRAEGAPEGCEDPLPGQGWTGSVFYPLEHYHDIHPNRGFRVGHPALDFDAPTGTSVRAAATGSVIWAGPNTWGYGNLVILDHGRGFRTLYAHLDTVLAKCDTVVMAGATIGTVGETGQASFEHVHLEVRESRVVDGKVQWWSCDPRLWLGGSGGDEPEPPPDDNEEEEMTTLQNPGFEGITRPGGWTRDTHTGVEYGEIYCPEGWTAWWQEDDTFRRPEMKVIPRIPPFLDPPRIYEGDCAFQSFTMFGRQHAGLYQVIAGLLPGETYEFTAWAHAWSLHPGIGEQSPRCSSGVGCGPKYIPEGDAPKLNNDPENDAIGNFAFRVGVSYGAPDPLGTVDWGDGAHIYNAYYEVPALRFIAPGDGEVTVYLCATSLWNFKNSDAYWDKVKLTKVSNGGDIPPPPQDCPGTPRVQYERTYLLMHPSAGKEWVKAAAEAVWDEHRYTIGGSADDAGIGALDVRNVIAVNPGEWPGNLEAFFEKYYPGLDYEAVLAATPDELREKLASPFDPGPPQPPPPYTPKNLINPHMQTAEAGVFAAQRVAGRSPLMQKVLSLYYTWCYQRDQAATRRATFSYLRAANSNCCKVFSFEDVYGVLRANPDTIAVVRHPCTNDYGGIFIDDAELGARRWVDMSRDALYATCDYIRQNFPGIKKPFFLLEAPNELYPSHNAPMVTRAANLDQAIAYEVQRTGLEIATVGYCAGVGNPHESEFELLVPLARTLEQTGGAMGLHLYWWGNEHESGLDSWWKYHAGRYQEVDKVLVAAGVHVDWLCGESGVVQSDDGYHLNPVSGWRDIMSQERYVGELLTVNQWDNEWNETHEGRFKLRGIFTSCAPFCNWVPFRMEQQQWEAVAAALK